MHLTKEEIKLIRAEGENMDQTGRISEQILDIMYKHRLFKLIVPEQFSGKMLSLPKAVKIFQEASRIDGNFGWLVTIGSGGGMFVPNMVEEAAEKCYGKENAVIAGSGFPAGTAEKVEGGYIINGRWFYCSGSQYASTFTVTCTGKGKEQDEEILAFALSKEQVEVIEDWNAIGLRGTSSHSIEVKDQFVPKEQSFSVFKQINSLGGEVHDFPFDLFSIASFVAISLGIGQHFLEEAENFFMKKFNGSFEEEDFLYNEFNKAKDRWQKANKKFEEIVVSSWEEHIEHGEVSSETDENFKQIAKRSARTSVDCVNQLFPFIGMQAIIETSELNQIWRDLQTASQHMFLIPHNEEENLPF